MDSKHDAGLYSAVINGNVTEVQKLLDAGATANATSYNNGDTPLHLALLQGHLHAAEVLRQYGASLETKNIKGETPEDKGRDELKRRRRKAVYWRNSVPTEIEQMKDEDSVPLYLQLFESGSEKKRDIRLVVVGKKGAGKTSLIKNLFGENGKAAKTNGIEIHRLRCKSDTDDGIWTKLDRKNEELEINARLLKPYGQTLKKQEEGSEISMSPRLRKNRISLEEISNQTKVASRNSSISAKKIDEEDIFTTNRESEVNVTQHQLPAAAEESETLNTDKFENRQLSNTEDNIWMESQSILQNEQAHKDIESMLNSRVDFDDNEDYASVFLWDFAGDEEFYHTHQTFLSPDAIYLVVTQMNETDKEDTQVMFRLWVDSIHCYCQLQQQNVTMNGINDDQLDPPIVVVGTFKDQVAADDEEQRESKCKNKLQTLARLVPTDALRHIRDKYTHFLSNTEDDDTVFTLLKKEIMEIARTMKGWNQDYPLKFIQLERLLREKMTSLPILSFKEIKKLADSIPKPLNTEELILFLKYHHEIREIVYFEDIPEYIILDTQWLANAFKCIVTAEDFQRQRLQTRDDWIEFNQKGKLSHAVIEDIYTNLKLFSQHILNVMEKFNIIIPCIKSNNSQNPCYYVPCMIKKELKDDIYERFGIIEDRKSLWLCFEFTFLPPHLMNHLVATLHRKYDFFEVFEEIALFKNVVVFDLNETGLDKLLVASYANLIQIQIWKSGEGEGSYIDIANDTAKELSKIIDTRFKLTNMTFEKKMKCSTATYDSTVGLTKLCGEGKTHLCKTCNRTHNFNDDWSFPFKEQVNSSTYVKGLQDIKKTVVLFEQKPRKDDLITTKKGIQLDVQKHLKIGLEVAFGRLNLGNTSLYKHHGIVTSICNTSRTFEIVELTTNDGNYSVAISGRGLQPKVVKTSVRFKENHMFYYDYDQYSFPHEVVKERAEMLVRIFDESGIVYNLYEFNCEHFASYCATGVAFCRQLHKVNIKATEELDKILTSFINKRLHPDGSQLNNKTDEPKKNRCLVM